MQYLGGYVLHNLHKKHGRTNSVESQQAIAILKAGKLESITDPSQKLVSALNCGGLWSITQPVQQIFSKAEFHFRQFTSKPDLQRLDISGITNKAASDSDILAYYNLMVSDAELEPDSHVCKDVLCGIISLYSMYMYICSLLPRISFSSTRSRQPRPKQGLYARKLVEVVKKMTNKGRNKTVNSHF